MVNGCDRKDGTILSILESLPSYSLFCNA